MLEIPKQPNALTLPIGRLWDGSPCPDKRIGGIFEIRQTDAGILIQAYTPKLPAENVPEAPVGSRVDGLWQYDVMEMFFVDEDGQYLEVELGTGGHYLVLGFDAPRNRVADFEGIDFQVKHETNKDGSTMNEIVIPFDMFPTRLKAMNAFLISGGQFLAYHPVPGDSPDFHQPDTFPFVKLS